MRSGSAPGRWLAATVCAVLVGGAVGAAAEASPAAQPALPTSPLITDGLSPEAVAQRLDVPARVDPFTPPTAALAAGLERSGVAHFDARSAVAADVHARPGGPLRGVVDAIAADGQDEGSVTWAVPAHDLSGDGHDDVLAIDYHLAGESWTVEALSGPDGSVLWRETVPPDLDWGYLVTGVDLTGDGADDLVRYELSPAEVIIDECPGDPWEPCDEYVAEWHWVVQLVAGATGDVIGSHTGIGRYEERSDTEEEVLSSSSIEERRRTGGLRWLQVVRIGGEPRVFVGTQDDEWTRTIEREGPPLVALSHAERIEVDETVHVALLAGSGEVVGTASLATGDSNTWLGFADLDGNGTTELVLDQLTGRASSTECGPLGMGCEQSGEAGFRVGVAGLADLDIRWTTDLPGWWGGAAPSPHDLDGDGVSDIIAFASVEWEPLRWTVLSGADGGVLYEQGEHPSSNLRLIDDVSGDGLPDVLYSWFHHDTKTLHLRRERGADGAPLLTTTHQSAHHDDEQVDSFVFLTIPGDTTGDGGHDALVNWVHFRSEEDEQGFWPVYPYESSGSVETLATGAELWSLSPLPGASAIVEGGDLAVDGLPDFLTVPLYWAGPDSDYIVRAINGSDGALLWVEHDDVSWGTAIPVGNADVGPGDDVVTLVDRTHEDGATRTTLELRHGATGQVVWARISP